MTLRSLTRQLRKDRRLPPEAKPLSWGEVAEGKPLSVPPQQHSLLPGEEPEKPKRRPRARAVSFRPPHAISPPVGEVPTLSTVPLLYPGEEPPARVQQELESLRGTYPKLYASLRTLDPAQLTAVLAPNAAVLVRAPVGSGKTRVLVHRVAYLHCAHGIPFRELAVLTFTNRAASEIRARIVALSESETAPSAHDLWLTGTFHSVARALLRNVLPLEGVGYRPDFGVIDDDACEEVLDELIRKHRLRIRHRKKLQLRLRGGASETAVVDDFDRLAVLYAQHKRDANAMDFEDLIVHATSLLALGSGEGGGRVSLGGVLVDEMQDCEPRDLLFLRALRGAAAFFGVGDPNQAIYGFRGSAPQLFSQAAADFGCVVHALPVNYRSTRTIVECARSVLSLEQARTGGDITPTRELGAKVSVLRHHNPLSEALYLAERLRQLHADGVAFSEMAILFRVRAQADVLRETLVAREVPCTVADEMKDDAVRILTLHSAKGLEFRWVFLSGINDGLLPLGRSRAHIDDAEERRLLFVGMTRAEEGLEISFHTEPHQVGAVGVISPYLRWLPPSLVVRHDGGVPDATDPSTVLAREATTTLAPPPACDSAETAESEHAFAPGVAVCHPRYGSGTVISLQDGNVDCDFGKRGLRSFPLALCPVTVVLP